MPNVEVIASCSTSEEALRALREEPCDSALLDIDMPGLTGLDLAALRGADGPEVIFVTAHPEHALAAFGVGATDYLLKPVDAERLAKALSRLRSRSTGPLAIPGARGLRLLRPEEISHAILEGETLSIHTQAGVLVCSWTLGELERRLPETFVRVSRQALVSLDAICLLTPEEDGGAIATLKGGERVEVSRAAARALRKRLG